MNESECSFIFLSRIFFFRIRNERVLSRQLKPLFPAVTCTENQNVQQTWIQNLKNPSFHWQILRYFAGSTPPVLSRKHAISFLSRHELRRKEAAAGAGCTSCISSLECLEECEDAREHRQNWDDNNLKNWPGNIYVLFTLLLWIHWHVDTLLGTQSDCVGHYI